MAVDTRRSSSSSSLPFDHHAKLSSPRATLTSSSPRVVGGALASPRASLSASAGSVTPRRLSTSVGASNGTLEADRIEYQVKQLFEQNTINGVREIESSTIADLNAKKKELRMLVGYVAIALQHTIRLGLDLTHSPDSLDRVQQQSIP